MEYLFQGKLDNRVHDITYDELRILYRDNQNEARESRKITESSYRGENFYDKYGDNSFALMQEILVRDQRTSGMRLYYPHGVVIEQAARGNYYRGENQIFPESLPTLQRSLKKYASLKEKELYRLVADMRVAEFSFLLQKFRHVREWKNSDILYEALAQHYGLETSWLDITSDFNVALFFATCYWEDGRWKPLTEKQIEMDEQHRWGMIFHMPANYMSFRWTSEIPKFMPWTDEVVGMTEEGNQIYKRLEYPIYRGNMENLVYPLGFQPFMRCHMQNGYGIYMRTPQPLQYDIGFEKLRFRHSEKLSRKVFELMKGGELIYPHEGLKQVEFIIEQIRNAVSFSEEAFQYALYRSHYYKVEEADQAKAELQEFTVNGRPIEIVGHHPWKLSSGRKRRIDELYRDFSIESRYGILVLDRKKIPGPSRMFEPWMMPEENDGAGVEDFRVREKVECGFSIVERDCFRLLNTVMMQKLQDF